MIVGVLFEIPWMLVLCMILFLLGLGVAIAPTVMLILVLVSFAGYWGVNFKQQKGSVPGRIICVLGIISAFFIAPIVTDNFSLITSLLMMLAVMGLLQAILILLSTEKTALAVNTIGVALCLVFSVVWTIGYDADTKTKVFYQNTAYYECTQIETYHTNSLNPEKARNDGKPKNGVIYDTADVNIFGISDDHIIGNYSAGDKLKPDLSGSLRKYENAFDAYDDVTWYPVVTESGQKGYIPNIGVKAVYSDNSAFVANRYKNLKAEWYGFLPQFAIEGCEKVYEVIPLFQTINVA